MRNKPLFVRVEWDETARVWVATSDDVPGLATEESSLESLIEKLKTMIPELLAANGLSVEDDIPFELLIPITMIVPVQENQRPARTGGTGRCCC